MELIRQGLKEDHILKKFITIILLHLTVNISLYADEIILQKNNIIITNDDLKKYKKLHQDFYGEVINNSAAIKKLYMTFKIIDYQASINPNFLKQTNKIISEDINQYKEKYSEYILSYFLRFEILKNDYISMHIKNNNLNELDNLLVEKINLYSDNQCERQMKIIEFRELNNNQKEIILSNLSNKAILISKNVFVCLSNKNKIEINNLVNGIFLEKGYQEFLKYVHKKIK
jgi:hypothetical protein